MYDIQTGGPVQQIGLMGGTDVRLSGNRVVWRAPSVQATGMWDLYVHDLSAGTAYALGLDAPAISTPALDGDQLVWTQGGGGSKRYHPVLEAHRRLLSGTPLAEQGGQLRKEQNWIGGSAFNPCSAAFVPPPWELVEDYLVDLVEFCNQDSLPPVAQAAVAYAQFETVHPFVDGNGRTGRVLIHLILRRRGVAPRVVPPVSLVLATWSTEYIGALTATRHVGPADSPEAEASLDRWIGLFAAATKRAVDDAAVFEERVGILQEKWRARLGRVRANSATDLLIRALPGTPVFTVQSAAQVVGRSIPAVNQAIARMVEAKVVSQSTIGRRNRAFEASELIRAFTDLERRLACPAGDTRSSPPARRVPRRSPRTV